MASTPLEVEAIKEYLISVGCKIEYPILVNAFKKHLYNPDPNVQGRVRTQFKDYVNRLATVSLENNMKFIILRPEFRPVGVQQPTQLMSKQPSPQHHPVPQPQSAAPVAAPTMNNANQRSPILLDKQLQQPPQEPRRLQTMTSQPPQPLRQQQQQQYHQMPIQLARSQPQNHDQMDSPRQTNQRQPQQHFQFPPNQTPSAMQQQQQQQQQVQPMAQPPPPPHQYHLNSSMNQSPNQTKPINGNNHIQQSRPQLPFVQDNHANQQKSLPPTPQLHSRTQSQPMPSQISSNNTQTTQIHSPSYQQQQAAHSPLAVVHNNGVNNHHLRDDSAFLMPPPPLPPPHGSVSDQNLTSSPLRTSRDRQLSDRRQDTPIISRVPSAASQQMPPPRPPPRRRQSTASLFKPSPTKPIEKISREYSQDLARKSISGRVREHATRFNSSASTSDLSALMPKRNSSMKENRLSRESVFSGLTSALQRNGSQTRSRSSHRGEDESDSSSLQPIDPLRRRWAIEACNCNYNNLVSLLREDPKLASYKDIVNGYTALHWAAKFGKLDIIKLIAGTHQVSANAKSSAGHTPLHVAYMFNRLEAANLLLQNYRASQDIRDHSGRKPRYYCQKV